MDAYNDYRPWSLCIERLTMTYFYVLGINALVVLMVIESQLIQ